MAVNKVEYGDTTLIDLTSDTVTKETLLIGATAHTASGESISGEFDPEIYLRKSGGDTTNNIVTFTSGDSPSPTAWTGVDSLVTGEKHSSLLNKISTMIKNVRFLYKVLGTTDISTIGDGTVTGAVSTLNSSLSDSGWKELTTDVFYRKKNGFVTLNQCNGVLKSSSSYNEIGILPEGYRPKHTVLCSSFNGGGSWIQISTKGSVMLVSPSESASAGLDTRGIVTFPVDEFYPAFDGVIYDKGFIETAISGGLTSDEYTVTSGYPNVSQPTYNTSNIYLSASSGSTCYVGTKNAIDVTKYTSLKINISSSSAASTNNTRGYIGITSNKDMNNPIRTSKITIDSGVATLDLSDITGDAYIYVYSYNKRKITFDKLWLE